MATTRLAVIILFTSAKGGTTKTTSAVHMAYGLAQRGFRVLLVDSDRQASSYRWYEQLTPADGSPSPTGFLVHRQNDPKMLRTELAAFRDQYDYIIIDTPGITAAETGALVGRAAGLADYIIVPTAPAGTETGTVEDTLSFIAQVNEMRESVDREPADVRLLMTRMDYRTTAAKTGRDLLSQHGAKVMNAEIPVRTEILTGFGRLPDPRWYAPVIDELFGQAGAGSDSAPANEPEQEPVEPGAVTAGAYTDEGRSDGSDGGH